jgi:hypothetical protein
MFSSAIVLVTKPSILPKTRFVKSLGALIKAR